MATVTESANETARRLSSARPHTERQTGSATRLRSPERGCSLSSACGGSSRLCASVPDSSRRISPRAHHVRVLTVSLQHIRRTAVAYCRQPQLGDGPNKEICHGDVFKAHDCLSSKHLGKPVVASACRRGIGLQIRSLRSDLAPDGHRVVVLEHGCRVCRGSLAAGNAVPGDVRDLAEAQGLRAVVAGSIPRVAHASILPFEHAGRTLCMCFRHIPAPESTPITACRS